ACGTIIATIVRRSASRPAFLRWSVRNDHRNYRAALRVATCIPALEREERSSQLSCDAPRRMHFWTLRVLFATCIKT
ncbi:hypothetical protein, partial [Pseudomonas savastanoi]|uniref:hypothetical protein n=1 Tax=Pseudomonas savastanoi TaxID=29438 RepID=UPI001C7F139D